MSGGKNLDDEVDCLTIFGKMKRVPRSLLGFRPAAYGLVTHDDKILLIRGRQNGKFCLPGGGINCGEPMLDALHREIGEETGLKVKVGAFIAVRDGFNYFDPDGTAWHSIALCWACTPLGDPYALVGGDPDEGAPVWVDVPALREEDCHGHTWHTICVYLYGGMGE